MVLAFGLKTSFLEISQQFNSGKFSHLVTYPIVGTFKYIGFHI